MIEWVVSRDGDDWTIGAPVAHVVLSGDHPAEELDAQLAQWGMKRSQLTTFEPEQLRVEFEAVFGPVGQPPTTGAVLDASDLQPGR